MVSFVKYSNDELVENLLYILMKYAFRLSLFIINKPFKIQRLRSRKAYLVFQGFFQEFLHRSPQESFRRLLQEFF